MIEGINMKLGLINLCLCFLVSIVIAPFIIKVLRKLKYGQSILIYVEQHKLKSGTPTMGGVIFIISGVALLKSSAPSTISASSK